MGTAAVRCCDLLGTKCFTPKECIASAKYQEAKEKCASIGMRLCTPSELRSRMCCTSDDCNFNKLLTWQGKEIMYFIYIISSKPNPMLNSKVLVTI